MKRLVAALALSTAMGMGPSTAVAQLMGHPVYANPKGGRGITIAGDYGRGLNEDSGERSAFAARATLGLSAVSVGVGVGTYDTGSDTELQYAGHAALRVIGGALFPASVAVHTGFAQVQVGAGASEVTMRHLPIGVGLGLNIPAVAFLLEPWVAPRYSLTWVESVGETVKRNGFGLAAGLNMGFAMGLALHAAADWSDLSLDELTSVLAPSYPDIQPLTLGIGLSYTFRLPSLGTPVPGPMNP